MHIEYHPVFVHFPIALVVVTVLFDWGRWIFDRERLAGAGFWGGTTPLLIAALVGTGLAVATGLIAEDGVVGSEIVEELIKAHETAAFIVTGGLAVLTFWRIALRGAFPRRFPAVYLALLLLVAAVLGFGAYFGGLMVFAHGVGVDTGI